MNATGVDLKEQLKKRLFESISAQIDCIGYVPDDIVKLVKGFKFDAEALGTPPGDADAGPRPDNSGASPVPTDNPASLASKINAHYDQVFYSTGGMMSILFSDTEYRNLGYWDGTTTSLNEAGQRLQDALLDFIPEKSGRILDVACGMGASTRRLLTHYSPENVWAINISERQIESTRKNAPGCHAQVMNAVDMTFEDEFFDNVLCIEAAFHFETRRKFLEEAYRILKRGGRLVLSDILFTSRERLEQYPVFPSPVNHLATAEEYRALLSDVGFRDTVVQDVSKGIWGGHFLNTVNRAHQEFYEGNLNIVGLTEILWTYYHLNAITGPCLFVCAQK
jgi:MPBQ/MSBQ methyltransferase